MQIKLCLNFFKLFLNSKVNNLSHNFRIFSHYSTNVKIQSADAKVEEINDEIQDYYLDQVRKKLPEVNSRYLAGMSLNATTIYAWFTNVLLDASPLSLHNKKT